MQCSFDLNSAEANTQTRVQSHTLYTVGTHSANIVEIKRNILQVNTGNTGS